MQFRKFGQTGLTVSRMILGTGTFGKQTDEKEAHRMLGVSNFLAYRLAKALGRQDTLKLTRFVSAQPRYNLLFREVERELFPLVQEEGLAVIPFNPLAGGLLSGKYKHGDTPEKGRFSAELGGTRRIRADVSCPVLARARV